MTFVFIFGLIWWVIASYAVACETSQRENFVNAFVMCLLISPLLGVLVRILQEVKHPKESSDAITQMRKMEKSLIK